MIIDFGEWLPDQPSFGNSCITATNVLPLENGYGPMPGLDVAADALASECRGIFSFRRVGGAREYFAGTDSNLYRKNGDAWDDVTPTGGLTSAARWNFALYGERVIATNGEDNPQRFDLASDSAFEDLTNAPKHRFPIVIRDVLVAVDLQDGSGDEVAFSAVNDSEDWTVAGGGGSQPFPDGGPVVGGVGGEYGVIFQEDGITRMDFVGGALRFTFDKIEEAIGCSDPASIVPYKGGVFYLSAEGFQAFNGASSANISGGKITNTFFAFADPKRVTDTSNTRVTASAHVRVVNETNQVQGALDPENSCVVWSFATNNSFNLLRYNYRLDRWAYSDVDARCLHTAVTTSGRHLAGVDSSNILQHFIGANLTATVSTGDLQLARGRSTFISAIRGLVDSAHDATVGKKTDLADTEVTATGSSNANGKCSLRSHGRYHRIQISPTATFTEISGAEIEGKQSGAKI